MLYYPRGATLSPPLPLPPLVSSLPLDYWHQTLSRDSPTVSLSSSVVSRENFRELAEELRKECQGRGLIFTPALDVCQDLERCYEVWGHMFRR
jgi:hypothetical protein